MGFLDKLKGAMNAVTGNAAKVTIEFNPAIAFPGDHVQVRITATSTGGEVKSKGVFVDLRGLEEISLPKNTSGDHQKIDAQRDTHSNEIQIAPAFVLGANETKTWEANVQLPGGIQPTYNGIFTKHQCQVRGRVEATGNDPDSGWQQIRIGAKA
jgi:hypothetical protein